MIIAVVTLGVLLGMLRRTAYEFSYCIKMMHHVQNDTLYTSRSAVPIYSCQWNLNGIRRFQVISTTNSSILGNFRVVPGEISDNLGVRHRNCSYDTNRDGITLPPPNNFQKVMR